MGKRRKRFSHVGHEHGSAERSTVSDGSIFNVSMSMIARTSLLPRLKIHEHPPYSDAKLGCSDYLQETTEVLDRVEL